MRAASRGLAVAFAIAAWWTASAGGLGVALASDEPPRPKAGIVPLELAQVAGASGEDLRIASPAMSLAGKRVRFVGKVAEVSATADGQQVVVVTDGDARVVLRMPGVLEDPSRLDRAKEWEVIARLDRPVGLADGRQAIAVAPDALVKTPAPPSEVREGDVIVRVAAAASFVDPRLEGWETEDPLYRTRVIAAGRRPEFLHPGMSALAYVTGDDGKRFIESRAVNRADDGRQLAVRCQFRIDGGTLRNIAYGEVELSPTGERTSETWVDFEDQQYHDKWSARLRSFPLNTVAASCLSVAISGFPFAEARVVRFYLWGDNKMAVPLYAYVDGEETIDVRGRPERARRVKLGLDVRESAKSIDVPEVWRHFAEAGGEVWFSGEVTYWVAAASPHVVLRYRGLLGTAGGPEVEIDRTR